MTDQELLTAIQGRAKEGCIECQYALELAEELEVSPSRIGRICNQNTIRIINCQLGCFGSKPKVR